MLAILAALSLGLPQPAAPGVESAFLAALAAGDGAAAQALLARDATIMHEDGGPARPATIPALIASLSGCAGEIRLEVPDGDNPDAKAFNALWRCGERGEAEMLIWTDHGRIIWVQLMPLAPAGPAADNWTSRAKKAPRSLAGPSLFLRWALTA